MDSNSIDKTNSIMTQSIDDYDLAMHLMALLYLGSDRRRFPDHSGYLDNALKNCQDILPLSLRNTLSFSITGVGSRCDQLPMILICAVEMGLIRWDGFSMNNFELTMTLEDARMNAVSADHSSKEFAKIGHVLVKTLENNENQRRALT